MTAPAAAASGPATLEGTLAHLSLAADEPSGSVAAAVGAVNALVAGWLAPAPDGEWAPHHRYGANLLAARTWRRKDSPGGQLQFGLEAPTFISSNWPDIAMYLQMGGNAPKRVG